MTWFFCFTGSERLLCAYSRGVAAGSESGRGGDCGVRRADGSLALDATLATSERRVEVRRREERAAASSRAEKAEEERERKRSTAAYRANSPALGWTRRCASRWWIPPRSSASRDARDAIGDGRGRRRASRGGGCGVDAARVVFDSGENGNGNGRENGRARTARSELKPGEVEDIAERAFSRALARETARGGSPSWSAGRCGSARRRRISPAWPPGR